jgi:hypothetical protein
MMGSFMCFVLTSAGYCRDDDVLSIAYLCMNRFRTGDAGSWSGGVVDPLTRDIDGHRDGSVTCDGSVMCRNGGASSLRQLSRSGR